MDAGKCAKSCVSTLKVGCFKEPININPNTLFSLLWLSTPQVSVIKEQSFVLEMFPFFKQFEGLQTLHTPYSFTTVQFNLRLKATRLIHG